MLLSEIDYGSLSEITDLDRWGAGTAKDRRVFKGSVYSYKLWSKSYIEDTHCVIGNRFRRVDGLKTIHGFQVGLYTPEISSAFVDLIYDDDGIVRGYATKIGEHPLVVPEDFSLAVFSACVKCGWIFSDLCEKNIIIVDGGYSLIDYDTHLVSLRELDKEFEEKEGALRPHILPKFRSLLLDLIRQKVINV